MPLPKVPNGQKISLILPAELVRRIKLEALDSGCLPMAVVQKALEVRGDNYPCASVTTTPGRLG